MVLELLVLGLGLLLVLVSCPWEISIYVMY